MRRRWVILVGVLVAVIYVSGTTVLAYARWFAASGISPVITTSDILTGWATFPRHIAHYFIIRSWNLDDPQPVASFALWDTITTAFAALVNVSLVVIVVTVTIRRRSEASSQTRSRARAQS